VSRRLAEQYTLIGLASAPLVILTFPIFNLSLLAWIALIPLTYSVLHQAPRRAFWTGWITGLLMFAGNLYWLITTYQAAKQAWPLSVLSLFALSAYLGLYWGAWSWLISLPSPSAAYPAFAASAWVALEYLRTHLFSGFPWAILGESQWRWLPLLQIASVTSVYGISFLLVLINVSFAHLLKTRTPGSKKSLGFSVGLLLLSIAFGALRIRAHTAEPPVTPQKVVLLQGNIDQYQKWDQRYIREIQATYERLVREAMRQKPALIVWPETSIPGYLLQDAELSAWLTALVQKTRTYHLVGAPSRAQDDKAFNTAYSLDPDGRVMGEYAKHHLVPFGEIVPWSHWLGKWVRVLNELGGFAAGTEPPVVLSGIGAIGVNICYEAIFPNLVRQGPVVGAEILANITNDGWYMRTAEPYQHFIPNIFRAVENDRWLIRADNTGISAFISPVGQVVQASPIFVPAVVSGEVYPRHTLTFYTRFGDVFAWLCIVFCFAFSVRGILARHDEDRTA
jgi:apolipoprotein N-acyltransferase